MTTYYTGDTIRLTGAFYTFAGVLADLTAAPTVNIYYEDSTTALATGTATKSATGTYYYDYTPATVGDYVYEFSGTSETKAIIRRDRFSVVFV